MQSFALFSPLIYFPPLSYDFYLCSFISDLPHLLWLLWHYFIFLSFAFLILFSSLHFSTFPNLLPISSSLPSYSQSSPIKFSQAGRRNPDSSTDEPSLSWLQNRACLKDLYATATAPKVGAGEGKGPIPCFVHLPTVV